MYRFLIAESNDTYEVYVNLISSAASRYISRRPYIIGLVKELIASQKLKGGRVIIERDMGRKIGTTDIVQTSQTDVIYYAQPLKSKVFSRFAKNLYPKPSNKLTVILQRDTDGNYEVTDTWIGPSCPAFPGDEHATAESKKYWQSHALVHDAQVIQAKSITKVCPY